MIKRFYLDTCVWRDFYEYRFGPKGRPLGRYASEIIMNILKKKNEIIFSETLIWELRKAYKNNEIHDMLNFLFQSKVLIRVEITKEEYIEAKNLSKQRNLPFVDCLNAILARNHKAIIVSQDKHFSEGLSDIAESTKPQDIS